MAYRDDEVALHARAEALELRVQLAAAQRRIEVLEAEVARLERELLDREATILDEQRRRGVPARTPDPIVATARSPAEAAARYLADGLERYRTGDRHGAVASFHKGLALVPDHAELQRALRRYS